MSLPRLTLTTSLLTTLALVASGCFTTRHRGDAGVPDGATDAVEAFLAARDRELCRRAVECEHRLDAGTRTARHCAMPGSPDDHRLWREGVLRFDEMRAAQCLEILRSGSGCFDEDYWDVCFGDVFVGTRPIGAACDWDHVCAPDLMCDGCACAPPPRLDEPCEGVCARGAICDRETFRCVLPPGPGSPCEDDRECSAVAPFCRGGECRDDPRYVIGEPCTRGFLCGTELMCDPGTQLCVARPTLGEPCVIDCAADLACRDRACAPAPAAGEPCGLVVRCARSAPYCVGETEDTRLCSVDPTGAPCVERVGADLVVHTADRTCPEAFVCVPPGVDEPWNGRCERRVGLGETCLSHAVCPSRSRCVDGMCVGIVLPDEPCGPSAVCPLTHRCDDGRCIVVAELPVLGEACNTADGCRFGLCVDGTCGRLDRPEGTACESHWECSGLCEEGRCQAVAREGEGCRPPVLCEAGTRCNYGASEPVCEPRCEAL